MKTQFAIMTAALAFIAIPFAAQAQGVVRGANEGAYEGNRAAGPVGEVVGGVLGGAVGGAVGGVQGVLGYGTTTTVTTEIDFTIATTVAIIATTVAIIVRSTASGKNSFSSPRTDAAPISAATGDGLCHRLESYFSSSWSSSCLAVSAAASAATDTATVTAASASLVSS
jgi:hypothetical protein